MKDVVCSTINEIFDHQSAMSSINLLAICFDIGVLNFFTSDKTNKELKKREITLIDTSAVPIKMTLWNSEAGDFDGTYTDTIVSIENGQLMEKNGIKYITNVAETVILHNPNIIEAVALQNWYNNGGQTFIQNKLITMALSGCDD